MINISLFRIARINMAIVLRPAPKLSAWIATIVAYLQYLKLRHELFAEVTLFEARMTPQVCYLEKLLQLYISPTAAIDVMAFPVILWRDDELSGTDLMIDDVEGQVFYTDLEFIEGNFIVFLPAHAVGLISYAKILLNKYKLPGTEYQIILV